MRKNIFVSFLLVLCLCANAAIAQKPKAKSKSGAGAATRSRAAATTPSTTIPNPDLDVIDGIVQHEIEAQHVPGAVVLVGHGGKIIFRKAYGMRSLEPARE